MGVRVYEVIVDRSAALGAEMVAIQGDRRR